MRIMAVAVLGVLLSWACPAPTLADVRIPAPEGWAVWMRAQGQTVFLAPDPEVEEALLRVSSSASTVPRDTLAEHVRTAAQNRRVVRASPVHEGVTTDGLAWLAQVVITEGEGGEVRHSFVAAVQGVRRAVVVHFETGRAETLSRHYAELRRTVAGIQFRS